MDDATFQWVTTGLMSAMTLVAIIALAIYIRSESRK
jgi:hypothetical protein